jgi:hypothetical protein
LKIKKKNMEYYLNGAHGYARIFFVLQTAAIVGCNPRVFDNIGAILREF